MVKSVLKKGMKKVGRVIYLDQEFSCLGSSQMLSSGEDLAKVIPKDWTVEVTGGPYRSSDVSYEISRDKRRVYLDFYSVRPGFCFMDELIKEVVDKIKKMSK